VVAIAEDQWIGAAVTIERMRAAAKDALEKAGVDEKWPVA